MSKGNGTTTSPAKAVARSMAELGHDAVTLAELQTELLQSELRQWLRGAATPAILLVSAVIVILGCVPVILLTLAYGLVEFAELSRALSLLIAATVGLAVAGVAAAIGWRRLRDNSAKLARSREEFQRNIHWIKQVLKHRANPARAGCAPQHSRSHQTSGLKSTFEN